MVENRLNVSSHCMAAPSAHVYYVSDVGVALEMECAMV